MGRGGPREAATHSSSDSRRRGRGRGGRSALRRGDAPAGRRRCRGDGAAAPRSRLVASRGRSVARRDAARPAQSRGLARLDPGAALQATLRPYQQAGVRWLYLSPARAGRLPGRRHGPGQDDPGAGAAAGAQAAARASERARPCLLVAPASLLANWAAEVERFAPTLRCSIAHPSAMPPAELKALDAERLAGRRPGDHDLRHAAAPALACEARRWRLVVLDEAQAIKNPGAKQTRAVKKLKARGAHRPHRHAGREPASRPVVALRFPQSRPAGFGQGLQRRSSSAWRTAAQLYGPLRDAGAALHPAAAEDRQDGHRRPARQDRDEGLLPLEPNAGGALPAGGRGLAAAARRRPTASSARGWSWPS